MMKKMIALLMALLLMGMSLSAAAEGLLPPIGELFETEMPNMEHALERPADETQTLEDGSTRMTFHGIGQQGFDTCNVYLGSSGCAIASVSMDGNIMTAQLAKEGRTFSFVYDQAAQTLVTTYPDGTYPEFFNPYQPGGIIRLGNYEQDGNTANGAEPIEWIVLAVEADRALLISRYALDCKPYNTTRTNVTWEKSTLRTWLNKDFLDAAFSSAEQAMIPTVTVSADKNPSYSTDPGNATQDKVFLLSIVEANKYFKTDSERQCKPTAYAKAQGADTNSSGFGWWWLRSPGRDRNSAAYVIYGGGVNDYGSRVKYDLLSAVRPALWIDLEP